MTINTINQELSEQIVSDKNSLDNDYKVQRFLRWFEKDGDNLVGEKLLPSLKINELQEIFKIDSDNLMYDCYLLETEAQFAYFRSKLDLLFKNDLYDYYLEVDAFKH